MFYVCGCLREKRCCRKFYLSHKHDKLLAYLTPPSSNSQNNTTIVSEKLDLHKY